MRSELINANAVIPVDPEARVSFRLFIEFLQEKILSSDPDQQYCRYVLERFNEHPGMLGDLQLKEMAGLSPLLKLIVSCVIPVIENRDQVFWAFGKTLSTYVFFASDAFYRLYAEIITQTTVDIPTEVEESIRETRAMQQNTIMTNRDPRNKFMADERVHRIIHPKTGLYQYYRLLTDLRFAWLEETPGVRRPVDIHSPTVAEDAMEGKGFTLLSVIDVTAREAIAQLDRVTVAEDGSNITQAIAEINLLLQTIVGDQRFRFGIFPFLSVDLRPATMYQDNLFSIIATACRKAGLPADSFDVFIENWHQTLDIKTYRQTFPGESIPGPIREAFELAGIRSLTGIPVQNQQNTTGLLEIFTVTDGDGLTGTQWNLLQPALPIMGRLLRQFIDQFNVRIEHVVKEKFTNIQQAVEWKFKLAAWHFISKNLNAKNIQEIEAVGFKNVYPFYGAVDIRNSTLARNDALRRDMIVHLQLLRNLLTEGEASLDMDVAKITLKTVDNWTARCRDALTTHDETELNHFLGRDLIPLLQALETGSDLGKKLVHDYRRATDNNTGIAHENSRGADLTMQAINGAIEAFYEQARHRLQKIHPCYFEKFRTDGVEYDIYSGQSLAPHLPYSNQELTAIRRWQLESMVGIMRITAALKSELPFQLETTQLIFSHSGPIDISFRSDERKFDVEGAYNIRYQMLKKRIDKVHLKGSDERLTRPGTIAVVYSLPEDIEDYLAAMDAMQEQNTFSEKPEFVELEDLQGVSGLRAVRLSVNVMM